MLFKGKIEANENCHVYGIGYGNYAYNTGEITVNITSSKQQGIIFGMGICNNYSKMNVTIKSDNPNNLHNTFDSVTSKGSLVIYYYGCGDSTCANYSEIQPMNTGGFLRVFEGRSAYNYGDMYVDKYTVQAVIAYRPTGAINFGNIYSKEFCGGTNHSLAAAGYLEKITESFKNYGNIEIKFDENYSSSYTSSNAYVSGIHLYQTYVSSNDTFADNNNYGNITIQQYNDEASLIDKATAKNLNLNVCGNALGKNYGNIDVNNFNLTSSNFYVLSSHGSDNININISNSILTNSNLYIYGSDISKSDTEASITGNINIDNIQNASVYVYTGRIKDYSVKESMFFNLETDVDISIENCKTLRGTIITGCTDSYTGTNPKCTMTSNGDISITNTEFTNGTLYIYGVVRNFGNNREKLQNKVQRNGNIKISSSTLPTNTYISNIGDVTKTGYEGAVSLGNITITDCKTSAVSNKVYIGGIAVSTQSGTVDFNNCYSSGNIELDNNSFAVYVSGLINRAGTAKSNNIKNSISNTNISVNNHTGNVSVSGTGHYINGIYNTINLGDIYVNKANDSYNTNIYGLGCVNELHSGINWGNITVEGSLKDSDAATVISPIGVYSSNAHIAVNYGNIAVPASSTKIIATLCGSSGTSSNRVPISYMINYGSFGYAYSQTNRFADVSYIVDMSGNKNVLIDSNTSFSRDSSAESDKKISYDDVIKPDFGFRYNNLLALKYISLDKREEYNGDSGLDYSNIENMCGQNLNVIKNMFGSDTAGGYIVTASSTDDTSVLREMSKPIEEVFDYTSAGTKEWWKYDIDTRWGRKTFETLMFEDLKQTEKSSRAEINCLKFTSIGDVTTDNGSHEKFSTSTSLIKYQQLVDGDKDGIYSENTIASITDVYMLFDDFTNLGGTSVDFDMEIGLSQNAEIHLFPNAMMFDSEEEMKNYITETLKDESYNLEDMISQTKETLQTKITLPALGNTSYAVIGYMEAEDGIHKQ